MSRMQLTENIWYDPDVKSYVMLDVTSEIGAQEPQVVDGVEVLPKDEYHVTLVAAGKIGQTALHIQQIIEGVRAFLLDHPNTVRFNGLTTERYICHKDGESTLIAPAIVTGLDTLRAVVKRHVPEYEPAFPHVTLLKSANSAYGISINTPSVLETYCKKIIL